jgi:uncharacterized protein with HEPN domain
MNDGDSRRIELILGYCNDIDSSLKRYGSDKATFLNNKTLYHAISMCLMQIGELSKGLSDEYRNATRNHITWGAIKGMRDWFAHGYSNMDGNIVWETASKDVPVLKSVCKFTYEHGIENIDSLVP